jgi:HlyD family secretion protein
MNADIRRRKTFALLLPLAVTVALTGCKPKASPDAAKAGAAPGGAGANAPTPVNVAVASEQVVTRTVPVTGSVSALQSVTLTPKVTANVVAVAGREGDTVRAGQVLVQQDTSDLQNQLRQAQANLLSARAKLTQARTQSSLQVTTSSTGVLNARAALASAEANLALAKQPQRTEQVQQSENAVQQAQANYDKAVADRKRYDYLVKEGAAAQSILDGYLTQETVQAAALASAKQGLTISQTGGRSDSIRSAQAAVAQARIALQQAQANTQQNAVKQDDIRAAAAIVAQNEAAVAFQKQQLADASIRSPIDGVISVRSTEPGALAAPGSSVMQVVALGTVYFQAQVPETDISNVTPGKVVRVSVDAYPGRTFAGKVTDLYPTASTSSRNFNVRVSLPNGGHLLRPGMFARGSVVIESRRGIVVPKDALIGNGDEFAVFVAENGSKAVRRPVKIGIQTSGTSEILKGIQSGDEVIVAGQDALKDGSPIHVEKMPDNTSGTAAASSGDASQEAAR